MFRRQGEFDTTDIIPSAAARRGTKAARVRFGSAEGACEPAKFLSSAFMRADLLMLILLAHVHISSKSVSWLSIPRVWSPAGAFPTTDPDHRCLLGPVGQVLDTREPPVRRSISVFGLFLLSHAMTYARIRTRRLCLLCQIARDPKDVEP